MCGICGIFRLNGGHIDPVLLDKMTSIMHHRGPDGSGSYISDGIGLGHRRLSIIDLEGGGQPISNEDDSLQIVFNGEIYNFIELAAQLKKKGHIFKTNSDTEVIIHAYEEWGIDCVNRFNGMFAFALWDSILRRLLLARDHLGVKPLYYTVLKDRMLFASEIKALLQDNECAREVDPKSLADLFTFRFVPSPNTLFKDVKKLPAGHLMIIEPNSIRTVRYWNWRPHIRKDFVEAELTDEYAALVEDAIRLQLRSDVPVGLFLSSGVDSSTILANMRKHINGPIYTFSIGFEGGDKTNETEDARSIASRFGAVHSDLIVTPGDYQEYYSRYMWDIEEPVGNETAAAFYFVSMIASKKVKVALTGQGADEPWAGYHRYIGVKLSELYSRLPRWLTERVIKGVAEHVPLHERLKRGVASLNEPDVLTRFAKIYSFYTSDMKEKLFKASRREEMLSGGYDAKEALGQLQADVAHLDPLSQMLYIDTRASLPDDHLMVNDKTSMACSLEARVPFLDYRIVEFIESLPPHLKLRGFEGKYLHKRATEKWLPRSIVYSKKKGFDNPIEKWLRGKMRPFVDEFLFSESSSIHTYFNVDFIKTLIRRHEQEKEDYLRHIYLLISFELWLRTFIRGS
jgi:asparagine synthase (glutamine-hydrolysing)